MRRWVILGVIVAAVVGGWYVYSRYSQAQEEAAAAAAAQEATAAEELTNIIWASGRLTPRRWAGLGPALGGVVAEIPVEEGQQVSAGDLLVDLDGGVLSAQADQARAALAEAEAARAKLMAGATEAQVAAAEAGVATADSAVALAAGQLLEAQSAVSTAEAQVDIAQRQYAELASHPTENEIAAAAARIAVAQAAVEQAQAAYNIVRGDPNIGALPQAGLLRQATAALEAAQADGAAVTLGPTAEQLSVAAAQVSAAEAGVAAAESRMPGAEAAVESALAQQASAQAALDALNAGATDEEVAMADAAVASAQAAVTSALANLAQMQIVAPFDGQIGQVNVRQGEVTSPGQVLVLLGDVGDLQVQTTDLRENDVVRLHEGMQVEVTFDALPDAAFQGTVERIAPVSNTDRGSTNYTVDVAVDDLDPSLRWGMTAFVNIQADSASAGPTESSGSAAP